MELIKCRRFKIKYNEDDDTGRCVAVETCCSHSQGKCQGNYSLETPAYRP